MGQRIVIDPVTRIEGHLRVEVEIENGAVVNAWTKGTMFRGIEQIIQGKDPRDAIYIAERICGVCATSHGWTAAMAVENAHSANLPSGARIIRNLMAGALWLHDHPLHFYHLSALDFVDVMAVQGYQGKDTGLLAVKDKVMKLAKAGDTAPLTPRYQPDDFSVRDPELVTTALAHYLEALKIQAKAKKMSAILGGKQPHQSSIVVGGVTVQPTLEQLKLFRELLVEVVDFIKKVYVPDVTTFATGPLLPMGRAGFGGSTGNYLAYGAFPQEDNGGNKLFKGGYIYGGHPERVQELDLAEITESVTSSWYKEAAPAHPSEGTTEVDLDKAGAYTFIKAPRYNQHAAEVGPLARMMVAKHKPLLKIMEQYGIKPGAVARHLARAQETLLIADAMFEWLEELEQRVDGSKNSSFFTIHDTHHWNPPKEGRGVGINEAPRGALGHWVEIENYKVKKYQIVVPTTWNASPLDSNGVQGPIEQALLGLPIDPNNPVNLVRVIRSFDPCLACAVHLITPSGDQLIKL